MSLSTSAATTQPHTTAQVQSLAKLTTPYLLLAVILPVFALAPLFYPGYFQVHSGLIPFWNVIDLRANLGTLTWTPNIATTFDPLRSAGLLPYYLAALLPVDPITAIKLVMGGGWLLGSVGMYLWLRSWLHPPGALIAALVYVYLPFQVAAVYVRGAWGEVLFFGLLPWAILLTTYFVTSESKLSLVLATVMWLALGMSQLGLTLFAFVLVALLLVSVHRLQAPLPIVAALGGTVIAASILLALAPTQAAPIAFGEHYLYPFQLFSAFWGFGMSRLGFADGMSFQLGFAAIGLTIVAIILWRRHEAVSRSDPRLMFFSGLLMVLVVTLLGWLPIDGLLALMLTYPWQLLGFVGLVLAIFAGGVLWLAPSLTPLPSLAGIIILVILSSFYYLEPQFTTTDGYPLDGPTAQLGEQQVAILTHEISVQTSVHTAGLQHSETTIPLAMHGPLAAQDTLQLELIWQPLQPLEDSFKVFVHLADAEGNVFAQYDGFPQMGAYPTPQWVPGEMIADSYALTLPAEPPPRPYHLRVGLYDETTLIRLPVPGDDEGRVFIDVE